MESFLSTTQIILAETVSCKYKINIQNLEKKHLYNFPKVKLTNPISLKLFFLQNIYRKHSKPTTGYAYDFSINQIYQYTTTKKTLLKK